MPSPISNLSQPSQPGLIQNIGSGISNFAKNYTPIGLLSKGIGGLINQGQSLLNLGGQQAKSAQAAQDAQTMYNKATAAGANLGPTFQSSFSPPNTTNPSSNAFNASQNPSAAYNPPSMLASVAQAATPPPSPTPLSGLVSPSIPTAKPAAPPPPPAPTGNPYTNPGAAPFAATVGALQQQASQPMAQYTAAQEQYNKANQSLADLRQQAAKQNINILGSRTNLQEAGGEQGLLSSLEALEEAPLTGEMQAAQMAAQTATGQQNAQQSGLAEAGGLGAPQVANPYGTFSPTGLNYTPYGGGSAGGSGIGAASQVTGNLGAGQNFYQNTLPNYNSALNDADSFESWLKTPQGQGGGQGINFSSSNIANQLQNWAQGQNMSDPRFAQLNTYLNDFTNKMSSVIGSAGGATTNYKQQLVNSMIQPDATPESIQAQMKTIIDVAQASMNGVYNTFNGNGNYTPTGAGATGVQNQTPAGYTPFFGNQ